MRLDLCAIFAFDDGGGARQPLSDVAAARSGRAAHVAFDRQPRLCDEFACGASRGQPSVIDPGGVWLARFVHVDDEGQRLVIDANEPERLLRRRHRGRRDRGDGLAHVADHSLRRVVEFDCAHDRAHPRVALSRGNVDGAHLGVRVRRAQNAAIEQALWRDVDRVADRSGDFGPAVDARPRLADDGKVGIGRQRRRLAARDLPLLFTQADAGDADLERFGAERRVFGH